MIIINMFYQYFAISTDLAPSTVIINNNKITPEQWGASMEDEVTIGDHGVVPLPLGIEREAKCIRAGLWTWKGSKVP